MEEPIYQPKLKFIDTQTILNGLAKLPYEQSAELIHRIKTEGDKIFTINNEKT